MSLTKTEQKTLETAKSLKKAFTPTELGMAMGFTQQQASSRVAPTIRSLLVKGSLTKTVLSGSRVTYSIA